MTLDGFSGSRARAGFTPNIIQTASIVNRTGAVGTLTLFTSTISVFQNKSNIDETHRANVVEL